MASSIFVVDSSPAVRRMVEEISAPEGFDVQGFQDGPAALEAARRNNPSLIIADYHLDSMTFSGFCKEIHKLDNLTDTYLVSLINSADRPDESHLRSLGVKTFLKKPFQAEDLLAIIALIQQTQQRQTNRRGLKRRVWPPDSTSTDLTEEDAVMDLIDIPNGEETLAMDHPADPMSAPTVTKSSPAPEDAMSGLFSQILTSMTERTEKRIAALLPQAIERELTARIHSVVKTELDGQLGDILSREQLTSIIQPLLGRELPPLLKNELTASEPLIRETVSELAAASIKKRLDESIREQVDASVKQQLPGAMREHLGTIDQLVKEEIRQATLKQTPLIADDIVRTTAEQAVEQAIQRIVPELAEQHIRAELNRLTAAE
ncbi:MAG TPA: response regulator [Nitrospira sp.]|nr:response regulator [Nitrospira sp.]